MGMDRSTLLDIAKATQPNGMPAKVIELMNQKNPIVQDAPAYPSNAPMSNRITVRNALPTVSTGKINKGVARSKGGTRQLIDTIGIFNGRSEIDIRLKRTMGMTAYNAERDRQSRGFEEALVQRVALELIYGNELTAEEGFTGLAPRLAALASAITGSQVVSMGSVTGSDGTSMYIVDWGEDGAHLIYPKDGIGVGGLDIQNKGETDALDADNNPLRVDLTLYDWFVGLAVKDERRIGRIANIDISDANDDSGAPSQGKLTFKLADVLQSMPASTGYNRVIYTHRSIVAAFDKQAQMNASNVTIAEYLGQRMPHYQGIPIRVLDQMSAAESTVS